MDVREYKTENFFDELFAADGLPRKDALLLFEKVSGFGQDSLLQKQELAEILLLNMGVTFNVYNNAAGKEKIFPFDSIPRIVSAFEWAAIEKGLKQRIQALNLFLQDIYNDSEILKDGVIPEDIVTSSTSFLPACKGLSPPQKIWCHITGTDLVRDKDGKVYVLEDNLRCPSGVSYVLSNRKIMKEVFPQFFEGCPVRPVQDYPEMLLRTLRHIAPDGSHNPTVVVLTPGIYNSAYYEHSFLAQQMGVELVEGSDLVVSDGYVKMRTTKGLEKVDVIYRRIDDIFMDPLAFREDSLLGVAGLMDVYRQGKVALANAPGTGIADDKVVYAYVPKIIEYYLNEKPLLGNVPTYVCWEQESREYVLDNLDTLVVKAANESGGYGMLIGPHATSEERKKFADLIVANPRNYIAQPTLSLSRTPVICGERLEGRHVDFRPFILCNSSIEVLQGGLTRVALKKGSLVVNSSQGGGSKDTWILADDSSINTGGTNQC